jgi:hypothetical protein
MGVIASVMVGQPVWVGTIVVLTWLGLLVLSALRELFRPAFEAINDRLAIYIAGG